MLFRAPEHGGDAVTGGGHPADSSVPAQEQINDAFGENQRGHGNTPGVGVPGSHSNPVPSMEQISERAKQIWEDEGRPEGKADEHWLRAEEQLRRPPERQ